MRFFCNSCLEYISVIHVSFLDEEIEQKLENFYITYFVIESFRNWKLNLSKILKRRNSN